MIFRRLADLFTNAEVEALKDKKDKIQSRLFCKLIVSLVDSSPDNRRGHYSSLANLFKCGKCGKVVVRSVSDSVPCIPSAMRLDTRGNLHSKHMRFAPRWLSCLSIEFYCVTKNPRILQGFNVEPQRLHCFLAFRTAILAKSLLATLGRLPLPLLPPVRNVFSYSSDGLVLVPSGNAAILRKRAAEDVAASSGKISVLQPARLSLRGPAEQRRMQI